MHSPRGFAAGGHRLTCALSKPDFLCELDAQGTREFDAIKSVSVYPRDTVVFTERDEPRGVFILCEGEVKLSISSSEGRVLILRIARPGDMLGLTATIGGIPHEVTAETVGACQVAFVRRENFLKFLSDHPAVYQYVLKHVASSYGGICDQLRVVSLSSIPQRLAKILLDWSRAADSGENGHSRIALSLTHEEIAECIGTTRETVTRTLRDFRRRRFITIGDGAVIIHNRKALQDLAAA